MYAASKVATTDNNSQEKFERIIKLWRDKGVYRDVDNLLSALRGELTKAEENVPAPDTAPDSVADPATVHRQPGGATVYNPLTQQNVPNFIPPAASAIPHYQMAPAAQLQPPEFEKPPQQPAPVQLPPPDFQQQQQFYQKLPFVPLGQQLPVPVLPPRLPLPTLLPPAPGASPIVNFPSQQPGQPIHNQPMQLPVGMQQPWVLPPMQPGIIPPLCGLQVSERLVVNPYHPFLVLVCLHYAELMRHSFLQLPPQDIFTGVGLPSLPLPPPSQVIVVVLSGYFLLY